jgi:PAS domain S-box-containing protein
MKTMTRNLDSTIIENIFIPDSKNDYEKTLIQQCFDMVNVFVVAIDLDANITLINKKGCQILGLNNEKLVGQNFVGQFITKTNKPRYRHL